MLTTLISFAQSIWAGLYNIYWVMGNSLRTVVNTYIEGDILTYDPGSSIIDRIFTTLGFVTGFSNLSPTRSIAYVASAVINGLDFFHIYWVGDITLFGLLFSSGALSAILIAGTVKWLADFVR